MTTPKNLMTHDEFELRYIAYHGMSKRFRLNRDEKTLINLTKITALGQLEKKLIDTSPEDIKRFTEQTYTAFKKLFLLEHSSDKPGIDERFSISDYINRLEYELKLIKEMGFNSYFLVVSDYIRWAKSQQISVGPGRGSGAGSVLAWFIGITEMDPLPFDLLFERFLNPARVSMPDFDIDFEDVLREKVIQYVTEKYGAENVCSIGTFMKMAWKAAFKDAARTLGLPFEKSNYVSNLIPDKVWLLDMITKTPDGENEEIKKIYNSDEKIKMAIDYGDDLTGNMRQLWVHACGIIIAPAPVNQFTPTQYNKESDHTIVSQYDWPTLEKIWLLKMDFLGLRNLSIIKICIKIIKAKADKVWETIPDNFQEFLDTMSLDLPLDDAETFNKIFKTWETTGIFQFESDWMRRYLIQLEPDHINNIIAMVALYRPWPMDYVPSYIERKQGREEISYLSADLKAELTSKYGSDIANQEKDKLTEDLHPIMKDTYWIAVYQEQLMFLVQSMAWFSLGEADMLRRWIGKKKKEVIEQLKAEFIQRWASFRQYKPETTKYIYEKMIEPAANYSFNKSHAACYALIAYQTAYLKTHYPVEFSAALIRSVEDDVDTQSGYISEIQKYGIQIFAPDINKSFNHVAAIDDHIRMGFVSIKWVGNDVWETIQKEREKSWLFLSLENFCKRCTGVINKKSLEWLIKSGTFDTFADRKVLRDNIEVILDRNKTSANADQWLFWWLETLIPLRKTTPSTLMTRLLMEQEVFKVFVSWNPLDWLYKYAKKHTFLSLVQSKDEYPNFEIIGYIKDIRKAKKIWFFIKITDITSDFEVFRPETYGLQKFDMIILSWSKKTYETKEQRNDVWEVTKQSEKKSRISIHKIIKTTYERLATLAWTLYDPTDTVVSVMKARAWELKPNIDITLNIPTKQATHTDTVIDLDIEDVEETLDTSDFWSSLEQQESKQKKAEQEETEQEIVEEIRQDEESNTLDAKADCWCDVFPQLPQDVFSLDTSHLSLLQLQQLISFIKTNPWSNTVSISGKAVKVSDEAFDKLKADYVLE